MAVVPVQAVAAVGGSEVILAGGPPPTAPAGGTGSFGRMLLDGVEGVNQQLIGADAQVAAFALDDSIPVHQVTYALEQARLSFELMMQVRSRLVESYPEIMRMQL